MTAASSTRWLRRQADARVAVTTHTDQGELVYARLTGRGKPENWVKDQTQACFAESAAGSRGWTSPTSNPTRCACTPHHELLDTRVHWSVAEIGKSKMLRKHPDREMEGLPPDLRLDTATAPSL